jgi:hypothetical protein
VEAALKTVSPSEGLIALAEQMLRDAWEQRGEEAAENRRALKRQLVELDRQTKAMIDMTTTKDPVLRAAYQGRLAELLRELALIAERVEKSTQPAASFEDVFELAARLLASPCDVWENGDFPTKNAVLRLVFAERAIYDRKSGLRTPKTTFPFKWLADVEGGSGNGAVENSRRLARCQRVAGSGTSRPFHYVP